MSNYNNNNNNNPPKWVEVASAWKGIMPQSGEESLTIKVKQGMVITLTPETKINLYMNKNKDVNDPSHAKRPDFRVMVPNDGSVVPVQQAAQQNNGGYNSKPAYTPKPQNNNYQNNGYQNNNYQKKETPAVHTEKPAYVPMPKNPGYQKNNYQNNGYQNNGYQNNGYQSSKPATYNAPVQQPDVIEYDDSDLPGF